ncbi:MAG: CoA-binding protein [Deltaproteobacteria bacterium]|nr:CoA-binding protein [Deltaproteobacteria bacterium]MBM4315853.1 CoA-binding protein [Deltaproteobacteria bacterium]
MPSIAIIGASQDRSKFGNKAVRVFSDKGYKVYPIHPKLTEIEGHKVYSSILQVPEKELDMVSFYLPPPVGLQVIEDVAKVKCKEVWLNPGSESDELVEKAEKLGLNVIQACSIVGAGASPSQY